MTVSTNVTVAGGRYVPWRTAMRGGDMGTEPVGTLEVDAGASGDVSGGTVSVGITINREEFGFPFLWVPTQITINDTLSTLENANMSYGSAGNERLNTDVLDIIVMRSGAQSTNEGIGSIAAIPIEAVPGTVDGRCLFTVWDTNENGKVYHMHVFGPVFDMQVIANQGGISELLSGVR